MTLTIVKQPELSKEIVKGFYYAPITLPFGFDVQPDLTASRIFLWSIDSNKILLNPTSVPGSAVWNIFATVDNVSGRTLLLDSQYTLVNGVFNGNAGARNLLNIASVYNISDLTFDLYIWITQF